MRALLILLCFVVVGCGPMPAQFVPKPVMLKNYEVGRVQSATVGDPIFRVQSGAEVPVFIANYDYKPSGGKAIPAGSRFRVVSHFPQEGLLAVMDSTYSRAIAILVDSTGTPKAWYAAMQRTAFPPLDRPLFRRSVAAGEQPGSFTAEIIYSGITGNTLRASYREYVDNLALPAFTQELQYDLSQSKEIAFRSVRIAVVEATNSGISYRVTEDGDLPWVRR